MNKVNKIYLIDDNHIMNYLNKIFLEEDIFFDKIEEFTSSEDGLVAIQSRDQSQRDVLFLDINMPMINGWEFIEKLRNEHPEKLSKLDVYILSCTCNPEDISRIQQHPEMIELLDKPLEPAVIQKVKSQILARA